MITTAQMQFECCVAILCASLLILSAAAWLVIRRFNPDQPMRFLLAEAVVLLSLVFAASALADDENGKPVSPVVSGWMRLRPEWVRWTHAVQSEWNQMLAAIGGAWTFCQDERGAVIAITNSIPRNVPIPKTMQLRCNTLDNSRNQNFKARPTRLCDNGDGTWTVEIKNSRSVSAAPTLMMFLRRNSDGATWWVEHESTSFPTNSSELAYTYTFRMPVNVSGYLAVADEVLLGGPNGLDVEGLVLVDPVAGQMYEGVSGTYIMDGRPITVKGGKIVLEASAQSLEAAPAEEERALLKRSVSVPHAPALAMPPLDNWRPK